MLRTNEALHERVRRWLVSGALYDAPEGKPRMGSGALCVVCSALILQDNVEYEIPSVLGRETLFAHRRCYLIWRQESRGGVDR